jgi:twitching motility protein PilT
MNASDVHLISNYPPFFRIVGDVVPSNLPVLSSETISRLVLPLMTPAQRQMFDVRKEMDFSLLSMEQYHFRVNVCMEKGSLSANFRITPFRIKTLEELGLPQVLNKFAMKKKGLLIVSGTAGCGKSTTMTYLIDLINRERQCKIITVEDPIEFVHKPQKSIIIQREVGADTESFGQALKYALRQDPDVVVVGEMRDLESISMTLTAAETGHLVLVTVHAPDTIETINRIIDVYPAGQQEQIRVQLAENLIGVISQVLIPKKDDSGRVLAYEILVATMAIKNLIRRNAMMEARSQMDSNEDPDMLTLETCLSNMIEKEVISFETAKAYTKNPLRLKMQDEQTYAKSIQLQKEIGQQPLSLEEKENLRLLIIDADDKDRGSMMSVLRREGYVNVASAETGKDGLNKLRSLNSQIVILDLSCHDVDSFQFCKWIKEQASLKTKVVLITRTLHPTDEQNVKAALADDFVVKTINFELLCKAIERVYRSSNEKKD